MTHPAWGAPHPEGQLQSILEAHVKGGRYVGSGMARFVLGCTLTKRTAQEGADMHSRQERLQCYVRGAAERCAGYAATKLACGVVAAQYGPRGVLTANWSQGWHQGATLFAKVRGRIAPLCGKRSSPKSAPCAVASVARFGVSTGGPAPATDSRLCTALIATTSTTCHHHITLPKGSKYDVRRRTPRQGPRCTRLQIAEIRRT